MNFSFIALSFVLFNFITWNQVLTLFFAEQDSLNCWTPDKKRGTCINIRQCSPLLNLLQKGRPLSSATINFLRRSHCGFEGRNPLVCCPEGEFTSSVSELQPSSDVKDVAFHPRLSYLLPKSCGEVREGDKITLGEVSNLYEFPWMALLGYTSGDGVTYRCAGTLINLRYILTAAHCLVKGWNRRLIRVRLGEYDLSTFTDCQEDLGCAPQVQDFGIEEVIPHPNYSESVRKYDIGLIRLNREVILNDAVRPICLPIGKAQQMNTLEGEKVTVTGWGATELGIGSSVLLKVSIPVVSLSKCAQIYNRSYLIDATQICAGGKDGKDSCSGDSGGPLHAVAQRSEGLVFVQHGVVSFGPKPCGSHQPGVYTKVGYYMDWILNTMKI